ncbi:DUF3618 domain-containing protein [Methylobacterium gnaphalii]|uniref:DUF3618 domain-containing protein n=1 Tax=Methylobacterium gnaphalii TaxID=1010610 RepID=A0A512JRC9_9HYPH|nr:DUF3618 domain-containing protein [Methylobacterium gnaphalii]GEP12514.1 hypothetical protein MGN01_43590 [Methylobacterium gnaphalii]GJD70490.1 hypothetical protein MMMDOFMJ_3439 [Methylobacterium gnaphalii]GLS51475.1 hypothetical protein GCM10007885_43320 [Methylobacterium gnaphalii]
MTKSAEKLEQEIEASRSKLENTLDDLRSRLNTSTLTENLVGTHNPRAALNLLVQRVVNTVRIDPVPVLLIGAGLAFLAYDAVERGLERRRFLSDENSQRGSDHALPGNHPDRLNDKLDDALEESFPGSDPVSVKLTK